MNRTKTRKPARGRRVPTTPVIPTGALASGQSIRLACSAVVDASGRVLFIRAELPGETRSVQSCAESYSRTFNRLTSPDRTSVVAVEAVATLPGFRHRPK